MKRVLLFSIILFLSIQTSVAQNRILRGTVTDAVTGKPLVGVNVLLKNLGRGVITDEQGNYKISVPSQDQELLFIYPGKARKEVEIGEQAFISVELGPKRSNIGASAHFAFGEERRKYLQPYAYQQIKSSSVAHRGTPNLATVLKGKASALHINETDGMPGSSVLLSIRANNSAFIDNQPLIVVDGLPLISGQGFSSLSNGMDYSSRINDINTQDIKSINVLKGASAAALYGSRGANGAVVITTFSGGDIKPNSTRINISQSYIVNQAVGLPKLQNQFGQGENGQAMNDTPYSWGPNIAEEELNDNMNPLFQDGYTAISGLDISGRNQKGNYNMAVSYVDQQGVISSAGMNRITGKLKGELNISPKISIGAVANINLNEVSKLAGGGNSSSVLSGAYLSPSDYDLWGSLFADSSEPNQQIYYHEGADNPRWSLENNQFGENIEKIFGTLYFKYRPTNWLQINYRGGGELLSEEIHEVYAIGSTFSNGRTIPPSGGRIMQGQNRVQQINSNINMKLNVGNPRGFAFDLLMGNEFVDVQSESVINQGFGITEEGTRDIANTVNRVNDTINFDNRTLGFFANARFSLYQIIYVDLAGRQDYSSYSTFDNSQYFNPTAGVSFVFSQLIEESDILNMGKLSASFSEIAQGAYLNPSISTGFNAGLSNINFAPVRTGFPFKAQSGNFNRNEIISPQITQTIDVGLNLELFKSKIDLQVNYFQENSRDQILFIPRPPSAGVNYTLQNSGEIQNSGIESNISISPLKSRNFQWTLSGNYTMIESKVLSVAEGISNIPLGDSNASPEVRLIEGSSFPVLYGTGFLRNSEGRVVVDNREVINGNANPAFGMPIRDPNRKQLGKMNPDFRVAFSNDLRIFGFSLHLQFDGEFGGKSYSGSTKMQKQFGTDIATIDRQNGVVLDAVKGYYSIDGNGDAIPDVEGENNIVINRDQYYWSEVMANIDEAHIYENNFIRLREAKLNYTFNYDNRRGGFIKQADIYVVGRNLWLKSSNPNSDPETGWAGATPYYGQQYFHFPHVRSFGGGINITF